jgi:replicative DNA helicase
MTAITRPSDALAEAALIGALLMDPQSIGDYISLAPDDFSDPRYGHAWHAMITAFRAGEPVDSVTVAAGMRAQAPYGDGEEWNALADAMSLEGGMALTSKYAASIRKHAQQWRVLQTLREGAQMATRQEARLTAQHLIRNLLGILEADNVQSDVIPYHEAISGYIDRLESYIAQPEQMLRFGFGDLDNAIGGVRGGDLVYLAGRPSMGKSSLGKPIGRRNAARFKRLGKGSVLHVSLEVPRDDITESHIANRFSPPLDTRYMRAGLRNEDGSVDEETHAEIITWAAREDEETHGHYFLTDNPRATTADVEQYLLQIPDPRLLIIDQFNLLKDRVKGDDEFHRLTEISHRLKAIAMRHNVVVLCLTQVKRAAEDRANRRPTMADLRGTGDQEQDADIVLGVYRPEYVFKSDPNVDEHPAYPRFAELLILKNRKGRAGGDMVPLYWNAESAQYTDWPHDRYPLSDVLACVRAKEFKATPMTGGKRR